MICSESQYENIPYRAHIHRRLVLITVMGRQTVCLRCGDMGHQRSTCPQKQARKSYAAVAKNQDEWQIVGSSRHTSSTTNLPETLQTEVQEEIQHVPLSSESEVGDNMGPPQDRRGRGQEEEKMGPRKTSADGGRRNKRRQH